MRDKKEIEAVIKVLDFAYQAEVKRQANTEEEVLERAGRAISAKMIAGVLRWVNGEDGTKFETAFLDPLAEKLAELDREKKNN